MLDVIYIYTYYIYIIYIYIYRSTYSYMYTCIYIGGPVRSAAQLGGDHPDDANTPSLNSTNIQPISFKFYIRVYIKYPPN